MKKIISLLSALAIFSSVAVTGFAATYNPSEEAGADSKPQIVGYLADELDPDGYPMIQFKVVNNEALSYAYSKGKYTSNGIDMISIEIYLDEEVFNIADSWPALHESMAAASLSGGADPNGAGNDSNCVVFNFKAQTVATYLKELPEYMFSISVAFNDGYDVDNIPSDAITYGETMMSYQKYAASTTRTNYTTYGVNSVSNFDYPLTVVFEGTAEEGGDNDDTAIEMVAGNQNIVGGRHDGKAAISAPEAVAVEGIAKITVENSADADRVEEWVAPTTLGNGKTKVLAVVTYDKAAMAGTTFTVKYLNAALEAIKTFTYTVGQ